MTDFQTRSRTTTLSTMDGRTEARPTLELPADMESTSLHESRCVDVYSVWFSPVGLVPGMCRNDVLRCLIIIILCGPSSIYSCCTVLCFTFWDRDLQVIASWDFHRGAGIGFPSSESRFVSAGIRAVLDCRMSLGTDDSIGKPEHLVLYMQSMKLYINTLHFTIYYLD